MTYVMYIYIHFYTVYSRCDIVLLIRALLVVVHPMRYLADYSIHHSDPKHFGQLIDRNYNI